MGWWKLEGILVFLGWRSRGDVVEGTEVVNEEQGKWVGEWVAGWRGIYTAIDRVVKVGL